VAQENSSRPSTDDPAVEPPAIEEAAASAPGLRRRIRRTGRYPLRLVRRAAILVLVPWIRSGHRSNRKADASARAVGRAKICILVFDVFSAGGTARTVLSTAEHLVRSYDVEIVTLVREVEEPHFPVPAEVRLTVLDDRTDGRATRRGVFARCLSRLPSVLWHDVEQAYPEMSMLVDVELVRALRSLDADIVVGTRHGLTVLLGELSPPGVITVAQVHLATVQQHPDLRSAVRRQSRRLDAVAVLTQDEMRDHKVLLEGASTKLVHIPNAVPPLGPGVASPDSKVVVAVGRLRRQKGFDLLIPAFERVVASRPDWQLRIFGEGSERDRLQRLIVERGLQHHVRLLGWSSAMGEELAAASLFVLSSRSEGFPMVLLEAMSKGLPVVSFDCPYGPGELITSGVDGLLVPPEDVDGLAAALLELIGDDAERAAKGRAALRTASQYDAAHIAARWTRFYDELLDVQGGPPRREAGRRPVDDQHGVCARADPGARTG
jgi:glycosyltransferase involved in cell wall biosynthesis